MAQTSLLPFVQKFEGYNPKPYWDHKQWSVGYGTRASGPNETIDKAEADRRLQAELDQSRGYVTQRFPNLAPHQADALTSFTYNLGSGWMSQPTKLRAAIESGDYQSAASVMQSYNKASGQVLPGLQNRSAGPSEPPRRRSRHVPRWPRPNVASRQFHRSPTHAAAGKQGLARPAQ